MCAIEQVLCGSVLHRGQYGEVCVFASTLCKYDLRKDNLFVLSWPGCDESVWDIILLWCL